MTILAIQCFRHILYPNGSLYFPKVRSADEGSYRCEGLHIRRNDSKPDGHQTFLAELALASKYNPHIIL